MTNERGSILFWIFIAIALFAALSFAVSNINRTGDPNKMSELAKMRATDIIQYAGAIQRGIQIMRANGTEDAELCFHSPQWGHGDYDDASNDNDCGRSVNRIFDPQGGSISFQKGGADWYDTKIALPNDGRTWVFSSRYEVENAGTTSSGGATEAANAELIMATAPLRDDVCAAINLMLSLPGAPVAVTGGTYDALAATPFNTDATSYSDGAGRIGPLGRERCVKDGAFNMYYKVISAR